MKALTIIGIVLGVFLLIGLFVASIFVGNYNKLVSSSATVDNSWAEVDTQYQRRFDLVPNLVASVKGAQGQELAVFTAIADARKQYQSATSVEGKVAAVNSYESNIALLPRLQEAYPELKSNATLNRFMDELTGTENRILIARNRYNAEVKTYNVIVKSFPTMFFAGLYGYGERTYFKSAEAAATAPTVDLTPAK